MNNTMKRRPYAAPTAELVCLAPSAPIANWTWSGGSSNSKWTGSKNHWFGSGADEILSGASVTGFAQWVNSDELDGK